MKRNWTGSASEKERWMHMLFYQGSSDHHKSVALFKLKVQKTQDGDSIGYEIRPEDEDLELVQTFYNQRVPYATCASLYGGKSYMIFPNEFSNRCDSPWNAERIVPYIYDLGTGETISTALPKGCKSIPFGLALGDKVYVLSRRSSMHSVLFEPSFEAYDLAKNSWETLETPFFFNKNSPPAFPFGLYVEGCAVFEHFIIVCVFDIEKDLVKAICSYDTQRKKWKHVHCDDDYLDVKLYTWFEKAVVFGNVIYAYLPEIKRLVSYSCTKIDGDGEFDLSLGKAILMEGWVPGPFVEVNSYGETIMKTWYDITIAIGKIDYNLLSVVWTRTNARSKKQGFQLVKISIIRIHEQGRCTTLETLGINMPNEGNFTMGRIGSCLPAEIVPALELGEHYHKKQPLSIEGVDAALVSDIEMMDNI